MGLWPSWLRATNTAVASSSEQQGAARCLAIFCGKHGQRCSLACFQLRREQSGITSAAAQRQRTWRPAKKTGMTAGGGFSGARN